MNDIKVGDWYYYCDSIGYACIYKIIDTKLNTYKISILLRRTYTNEKIFFSKEIDEYYDVQTIIEKRMKIKQSDIFKFIFENLLGSFISQPRLKAEIERKDKIWG